MKFYNLLLYLCFPCCLVAQTYPDHFGAGQYVGISVSSSDEDTDNAALYSIDGTGIKPDLTGAARFLAQATMGYNYEQIEYVSQIGIDAWLEEQFDMPSASYATAYNMVYDSITALVSDQNTKNEYLSFVFYDMLIKEPDVLRHKVAFALSQILVTSTVPMSNSYRGKGAADYYDILYEGAFGNYRDMLLDVTLHPFMGIYLSYFQNRKADFGLGTLPDENYAREIMQLFTIGLLELNNDGTLKLDANGNTIPTYDIKDVQELSKVFTGFASGATRYNTSLDFDTFHGATDLEVNMTMYEDEHDKNPKKMIDGTVLPPGQAGLEDINDAIDVLFNHPNIAPFISIRLIQQLVKSNPSPEYINRVASVFNNNGQGVRGDLEAVVRAILTDPEAINCNIINTPQNGKLIQPVERLTNLLIAFDVSTPSNKYWLNEKYHLRNLVAQSFMRSPSVFNFFTPFYAEGRHVRPNDLVSPEFQILDAITSIHYINLIEDAIKIHPFYNYTATNDFGAFANPQDMPVLDFTDEIDILNAQGMPALLDRLDILLCRGQLSNQAKAVIEDTISQFESLDSYTPEKAVKDAIFLIMVSPNYMILK